MIVAIVLYRMMILLATLCGMFLFVQFGYSLLFSQELVKAVESPKTYTFIAMIVFAIIATLIEVSVREKD